MFVLVHEVEKTPDKPIVDGNGNIAAPGEQFLRTAYSKGIFSCTIKEKTSFYKESILYPFVHASSSKKGYIITNSELVRFWLV